MILTSAGIVSWQKVMTTPLSVTHVRISWKFSVLQVHPTTTGGKLKIQLVCRICSTILTRTFLGGLFSELKMREIFAGFLTEIVLGEFFPNSKSFSQKIFAKIRIWSQPPSFQKFKKIRRNLRAKFSRMAFNWFCLRFSRFNFRRNSGNFRQKNLGENCRGLWYRMCSLWPEIHGNFLGNFFAEKNTEIRYRNDQTEGSSRPDSLFRIFLTKKYVFREKILRKNFLLIF